MQVPVNYLAVIVAAVASYVIAFVWYGLVFRKLWMKLTGVTEMKPTAKNVIIMFLGSLVMSYVLVHSIAFGSAYLHSSGLTGGLQGGFFNWLGFIAPVTVSGVIYENRSWKLWVLDNGFWLLSLFVMGAILSSWV